MALLPQGVWRKAVWRGPPGLGRLAALLTLAALMVLRVWDPPLLETLRGRIFDTYQRLHPREVTEYPVTIVDIDERSLREIGQWPWSRARLAEMLAFFELTTAWYEQVRKMPKSTLARFAKMGSRVARLLDSA